MRTRSTFVVIRANFASKHAVLKITFSTLCVVPVSELPLALNRGVYVPCASLFYLSIDTDRGVKDCKIITYNTAYMYTLHHYQYTQLIMHIRE